MKLCPVGFRQIQMWQYESMVPKTKQKERKKGLAFARLMHPVPHNHPVIIGSPVGGPHSAGEIRGAAAVNVLSRVFAFAAHGGALGWEWR